MMTMLFVHEDAAELGIQHPVAYLINNVTVQPGNSDALSDDIATLMKLLNEEPVTIVCRPEVRGFNDLFAHMGYPKQVPAGQRLIESLRKRGFKRYDNVVDAYNIASASYGSGLGMHDARWILGDIHVYRARGHEQIVPMFKNDWVEVVSGDLVYADGAPQEGQMADHGRLLAWLGKRDVDSDKFKVRDDSKSLLIVALGNGATPEEYNRGACLAAFELIRRTCPKATAELLQSHVGVV